ncbi:hypothetical protein SAMN02745165_03015 [Malonomonas rubra DSM 5091]|uniref:Uncharacterized protein n=1 Tax=Malonomonas rubra DSM 5091 TaxID=1122189 RepID=A0A1M6LMT7_MALRU|nr:hypothetical protein [Malonomonas rubra]SHJ72497.1 hypothetical protein SAMN02745165_03015 [Malonomonas rubra DSM 5091]
MVPESVQKAWQDLPENRKAAVSRAMAKKQPFVFTRWVEAAGVKNFRREMLIARKAGTGPRLDKALYSGEEGHLAVDVLVAYFTELAPEVNDQYLAMLEEAGDEGQETKLKLYARLLKQHTDWPYLQLYLATALWVEEFAEEDIEKVRQIAAELEE